MASTNGVYFCFVLFFFSSRRRHTRWPRDWSSDVCSSDLFAVVTLMAMDDLGLPHDKVNVFGGACAQGHRSEERRVGKEGECRWGKNHSKRKRERTEV